MDRCCFCNNMMSKISKGNRYEYYRCPRCGWYSTKPLCDDVTFDYDSYDTFDSGEGRFNEFVQKASSILQKKFSIIQYMPESFLDVGCSEGPYIKAFIDVSEGKRAKGVEVAASKVKRARARGLDVVLPEELGQDEQFEFVYIRHVIEHIENPLEFIRHYARFVKKHGYLVMETPNSGDIKDLIWNRNRIKQDRFVRDLYPPTHVCGYEKKTFFRIGELLMEQGFMISRIITYDSFNPQWVFENSERYSVIRRFTEKIGLAQNLAGFYLKADQRGN